jgi:hypothetical protein
MWCLTGISQSHTETKNKEYQKALRKTAALTAMLYRARWAPAFDVPEDMPFGDYMQAVFFQTVELASNALGVAALFNFACVPQIPAFRRLLRHIEGLLGQEWEQTMPGLVRKTMAQSAKRLTSLSDLALALAGSKRGNHNIDTF